MAATEVQQFGSWKRVFTTTETLYVFVTRKETKKATFISLLLLVSRKEHCTRHKKLSLAFVGTLLRRKTHYFVVFYSSRKSRNLPSIKPYQAFYIPLVVKYMSYQSIFLALQSLGGCSESVRTFPVKNITLGQRIPDGDWKVIHERSRRKESGRNLQLQIAFCLSFSFLAERELDIVEIKNRE